MSLSKQLKMESGTSVASDGREHSSVLQNQQLHPLDIPPVLKVVFAHCGLEALKNCRLVNKQWLQESRRQWFRCGPIVNATSFPRFERISQIISVTTDNPAWASYNKFHLTNFPMWGGNWSRMDSFWTNCGEWMTELNINCSFIDIQSLKKVLFCQFTPNLVSLKINFKLGERMIRIHGPIDPVNLATNRRDTAARLHSFIQTWNDEKMLLAEDLELMRDRRQNQDALPIIAEEVWRWPNLDNHYANLVQRERDNPHSLLQPHLTQLRIECMIYGTVWDIPVCWVELLWKYSNLKVLQLFVKDAPGSMDQGETRLGGFERALRALCSIREVDNTKLALNELACCSNENPSLVPLLRRAKLSLETLRVKLTNRGDIHNAREFAELSGVTLRKVALETDKLLNFAGNEFSRINFLQELHLNGDIFGDMSFLRYVPTLEILSIAGDYWGILFSRDMRRDFELRLHSLHDFKIETRSPCTLPSLKHFAGSVGNLTSLHITLLSNSTLQFVCQRWTSLVNLKFSISGANDVVLTNAIRKLKALRSLSVQIKSFSTKGITRRTPNERLENFIVKGILELKKLKILTIEMPQNICISKGTQSALHERIQTVKIKYMFH